MLCGTVDANSGALVAPAGLAAAEPVNGPVLCFDRKTGKHLWTSIVERQTMPLGQPQEAPVLLFTTRVSGMLAQKGGRYQDPWNALALLDSAPAASFTSLPAALPCIRSISKPIPFCRA